MTSDKTDDQRAVSVNFHLQPLRAWMEDPEITEICINRPGEVWCERACRWEQHDALDLTFEHLRSLATAIASFVTNEVSDLRPILSATLPAGERVQIVLPPVCEQGTASVTIRKPSSTTRTLDDYVKQGFFAHIQPPTGLNPAEQELTQLKARRDYPEFLARAVQLKQVIVVAGETGSGKTTLMKTLVEAIPRDQRIITIEDVPELFLPNHLNHVHLFYPSEARDEDLVTAASLLRSCFRMKPTRILLAECRGSETFDFINVAASGHDGSITGCHAGSAELAFERLALMILQNRQGRTLPYAVIRRLLYLVVDVIVHVHNDLYGNLGRHITEIWYEPSLKRSSPAEK